MMSLEFFFHPVQILKTKISAKMRKKLHDLIDQEIHVTAVQPLLLSVDDFEIKSKIYSLNCLSCFYSYFELQDDFILRILFVFIFSINNYIYIFNFHNYSIGSDQLKTYCYFDHCVQYVLYFLSIFYITACMPSIMHYACNTRFSIISHAHTHSLIYLTHKQKLSLEAEM